MQEPSNVTVAEKSDTSEATNATSAKGRSGTGRQPNASTKKASTENGRIRSAIEGQEQLKRTTEKFLILLKDISPVLFTVEMFNQKFLKDMQYGEIHVVQYVRNGRVYKIDAYPRMSTLIEPTEKS